MFRRDMVGRRCAGWVGLVLCWLVLCWCIAMEEVIGKGGGGCVYLTCVRVCVYVYERGGL